MDYYIGLMSGTSADGIDVVLVDFSDKTPRLVATDYLPYGEDLRNKILSLCEPGPNEIDRMGELDQLLGEAFAKAVNAILNNNDISPAEVKAIGSHGQTIRHRPDQTPPFTLQIGDPNLIAAKTGITTIADFRRKDMAYGGQGAPLVPAFHQAMFASKDKSRVVVNIGGMANVSLLHAGNMLGFDTGPGNVLMDAWIQQHQHLKHDEEGGWAASGTAQMDLLQQFLTDSYFHLPAPKSTGREYFNLNWLHSQLAAFGKNLEPADVQATLAELTAQSIVNAIRPHMQTGEILICGGGAHNDFLVERLANLAQPDFSVFSTEQYGIHPDWVEAMAFAWLARQTLNHLPGNHPNVTGASQAAVLGGVYCC